MANISAVSNGDWHTASTWSTSGIPTSSDTVYLGGYTVTLGTSNLAECQDLVLHTDGTVSTLGTLHVTSTDAFLDIVSDIVVGGACTPTEGSIFILGTCSSCEITVGGTLRSVSTSDMTYGFIQRRGNFSTACDITINGSYVSPSSGINSWMLLGAYNTNTSVYDTWTWNGSITFDGHQNGGSYRGLINGDTSPAINLIVNGDVYFDYTADGMVGGMLLGTIDPPNPMSVIINGSLTNGGDSSITSACYALFSSAYTADTYSLGRTLSIDGDVTSLDVYPAIVARGGNLTVIGAVTSINGLGTAIQLEGDVSGNLSRIVSPASSDGVVQYGSSYVGGVSISEVDCRDQSVSTTDTLVSLAANSVPVDIYLDVIYPGACIGVKPTVNASTTLVVDTLHTADTSTASALAVQPGIDTAAFPSVRTVLSSLIVGNLGAWPISGMWQLADASSIIQARDQNNQPVTLAQGGNIPIVTDVRLGVAVGSDVGTLIVPQAANVAVGVVYDNGTVGTLNSSSGLTTLQSDISAIRLVTDQLELVEQQEAGTDRYYNDVVSLINLSAATPGAASFTDTQGHTFTRNGSNANIVASPVSLGNQSLSLRGSYFSYSDASLVLGVSDFTIELFVILDGTPNNYGAVIAGGNYNNGQWSIRRASPTQLLFTTGTGANVLFGTLDAVSWYHLAVVRESGVVKTYLNGALGGTGTDTVNYSSSTVYLGTDTSIIGHSTIANVRITKTVRYTTGFTVPTVEFPVTYKEPIHAITAYIDPMIGENVSQLVVDVADIREVTDKIGFVSTVPATHDRDYSSVVTLINLKEAIPNTATFMDIQGHTFTRNGSNARVDTTETYLGNPVITLTGNIFNSTSADFALGTSDFTIEFWFKPNTNRTMYGGVLSTGPYSSGHWSIRRNGTSSDFMYTTGTGAGAVIGTIADNTWAHVAVVRESGVVSTYLNGGLGPTVADTRNYTGTTLYVGTDTNFVCQGTVSNVRISRIVRYTTGFIVPTVEYPVINAEGYYEVIASGGNTVDSSVQLTTIQTALSSVDASVIDIKAKTDQLAFTSHGVVSDTVDPNVVTDISVAVTDGNWDTQSTWEDGNIPLITSFVFTNGKEVIVNGTVECAGVADTSEAGGLIVDAGGNVALKSAYGDELYSSVYYLANLDGNINNLSYGAGSATFGSGAVPTYSTAQTMGVSQSLVYEGSTSASVNVSMPALASGEEITVEYWVKHNPNNNVRYFYFGYIDGSTTSFLRDSTSISFSRVVQPSEYSSGITAPIILNQWYHIALVRKSDNTWSWYENGNRLANVAGLSSIPARVWGLFTDNPYNGSGRHINGWVTHPRITVGVARYTGVTYAIPYAPFPQYAPAPGSTISGRVVLGTNGAVVQAGNNPNSVRTGILQSIAAKLMYGNDAILNSIGSVVAPDNTARFDALDNVASGIKAQTDLLTFTAGGVVADVSSSPLTVDIQPVLDAVAGVQTDVTAVKTTTSATGTTTAAIKAKTDQLTFGINGVNATTTSADYTTRFNSIDGALTSIQEDLNDLDAGDAATAATLKEVKNLVIAGS